MTLARPSSTRSVATTAAGVAVAILPSLGTALFQSPAGFSIGPVSADIRFLSVAMPLAETRASVIGGLRPTDPILGVSTGPQTLSLAGTRERGPSRRQRELAWIRANRAHLRQYAGEWIVVEGHEFIAHGRRPEELVREARRSGIRVPFLYRVEEERGADSASAGL